MTARATRRFTTRWFSSNGGTSWRWKRNPRIRRSASGYGQIAAKFWAKESENRFAEKFRKHIPVIAPLWVAPVACGGWSLWSNYSVGMLALLVAFALDAFIVLPLVSRIYGCAHCPQKEGCPWMGGKAKET